jgi:hypothetical protein
MVSLLGQFTILEEEQIKDQRSTKQKMLSVYVGEPQNFKDY